jgi:hypothetical protein
LKIASRSNGEQNKQARKQRARERLCVERGITELRKYERPLLQQPRFVLLYIGEIPTTNNKRTKLRIYAGKNVLPL